MKIPNTSKVDCRYRLELVSTLIEMVRRSRRNQTIKRHVAALPILRDLEAGVLMGNYEVLGQPRVSTLQLME